MNKRDILLPCYSCHELSERMEKMLSWNDVITLRMQRQALIEPVARTEYDRLYYLMSPVMPQYWTEPGSPPTLPMHVGFDDYVYNTRLRAERKLLKGRFAGGNIAYVAKEDLEVFACLYKKEITTYSELQLELLELLRQEGPMNIGLMKELTKALVKEITPALHRLQEAFILYEDQLDNEGDRGWYLFESEFPEIELNRYSKLQALKQVLSRAAHLLVFFDEGLIKSYFRLPAKLVKETIAELLKEEVISSVEIESKAGYMLREDFDAIRNLSVDKLRTRVKLLQRNDFLVRTYSDQLKEVFHSEHDILYYLLVDGVFHGAVVGRFKFGPHVIEDIVLDLNNEEKIARKEEILTAVYQVFDEFGSPIKRYDGVVI